MITWLSLVPHLIRQVTTRVKGRNPGCPFLHRGRGPAGVNFKAVKEALHRPALRANPRLINHALGLPRQRAKASSTIQTHITHETESGRLITTSGFHEDIIVSSRQSLLNAALLVAAHFGRS